MNVRETTNDDAIVQAREPVTKAMLTEWSIDLATDFPDHAIEDLSHYPVLSEGGWFLIIKNQRTLETIARRPWRLLGPIRLLSEGLDLD